MFEKYKKKREQMEFMGMRKGEYIRFVAMLIVMGVIALSMFFILPKYFVEKVKAREGLPTDKTMKVTPPPEKVPERIGDRFTKEYVDFLNKKLKEKGKTSGGDILEPKVPPPRKPFKENPRIWDKVVDYANYVPSDVQEYVFHMLNSMTQDEIDRRAKAIHLKEVLRNPKEYHGKFIHVVGRLLNLENRYVKRKDVPSGVTQFWLGKLWRIDEPKSVLFCIFDKHKEFECDPYMGDDVELTGVFVMMLNSDYETKTVIEPFVIGRRLKIHRSRSMFEDFPWVTMLIIGAAMLALLMFFILKARTELKQTERFMQKVRARMMETAMAHQKKDEDSEADNKPIQGEDKTEEQTASEERKTTDESKDGT